MKIGQNLWGSGMSILAEEKVRQVEAKGVRFEGDVLVLELSDGRELSLPLNKVKWLDWLAQATPEQKARWTILPHGYGVYWVELDDGFEVEHALSLEPVV